MEIKINFKKKSDGPVCIFTKSVIFLQLFYILGFKEIYGLFSYSSTVN